MPRSAVSSVRVWAAAERWCLVILRDCRLGELWRVGRVERVLVACGPVWFLLEHARGLLRLNGGAWVFSVCCGGSEVGRVDSAGELVEAGLDLGELEAAA